MDGKQLAEVRVSNAMPIVSSADSRIVFDTVAPQMAHRVLQIAMERLNAPDAETQDSGIKIVGTFRKQLFSEKPAVSVNVQAKVGMISDDARSIIDSRLGRGREVVAQDSSSPHKDSECPSS